MDIDVIRNYCAEKPHVTESFPFDDTTLVFKVKGKMFALLNLEAPFSVNLKCDPEKAVELRERYDFVLPGYHMNKKHWNTIMLEGRIPSKELFGWIDDSYELIHGSIPKIRDCRKNPAKPVNKKTKRLS